MYNFAKASQRRVVAHFCLLGVGQFGFSSPARFDAKHR